MNIDEFLKSGFAKESSFDLIVMTHVLEHLSKPKEILEQLGSLLNPCGQLLLVVPNAHSFTSRILRGTWGWWQTPLHLFHYTLNGLHVLLKTPRFEIKITKYRGADSLFLLQSLRNLFSKFAVCKEQNHRIINSFKRK